MKGTVRSSATGPKRHGSGVGPVSTPRAMGLILTVTGSHNTALRASSRPTLETDSTRKAHTPGMRMTRIAPILTATSVFVAGVCNAQQRPGVSQPADDDRVRAVLLSPGTAASTSHPWQQADNDVFGAAKFSHQIMTAVSHTEPRSSYALVGAIIGGVPLGLLAYGSARGLCDGGCTGDAVRWGIGAAAIGATLGAMIGSGIERQ